MAFHAGNRAQAIHTNAVLLRACQDEVDCFEVFVLLELADLVKLSHHRLLVEAEGFDPFLDVVVNRYRHHELGGFNVTGFLVDTTLEVRSKLCLDVGRVGLVFETERLILLAVSCPKLPVAKGLVVKQSELNLTAWFYFITRKVGLVITSSSCAGVILGDEGHSVGC